MENKSRDSDVNKLCPYGGGGGGGGAPTSDNIKLLFIQQLDMTDDNAVPCGKRASPPETLQLRAVGQRNKSGRGQEVRFLRYKVLSMLLCFLFFSFWSFQAKTLPTKCSCAPPFVKKARGTLSPALVTDSQFLSLRHRGTRGCFSSAVTVILFVPVSPPRVSLASDPFLHGAFAVENVAWRPLPLELYHSVDQHQQAQQEHAGDDNGDGLHRVGLVVQLDHHVGAAVVGWWARGVDGHQLAAHKVLEDGARVARLYSEELVVELPVLLPFVEVGET